MNSFIRTLGFSLLLLGLLASSPSDPVVALPDQPLRAKTFTPDDTGGMQRVGKLTLSDARYSSLYNALIDPVNGYAYFTSAHAIDPGWVIKVDISGPLPVEVGATPVMTGESNLIGGAIDVAAGYAYFGTTNSPAHIIKIALGVGNNPPVYVGSLTLNSGENSAWGAVIDTRDADPANHFLYFAIGTSPGQIVKVAPGVGNNLPTRVAALTLALGENSPRRGVIDLLHGYAYFATANFGVTTPKVMKIELTTGSNPPLSAGTALLEPGIPYTYSIGSAVIDPAHGYAYFGSYNGGNVLVPAKVYKVALGAGSAPPTLVGAVTLNAGERELSSAVIDTVSGYAYFGTDHTYPGKIYQIWLGVGDALPAETGLLPLQGGTQPNPPDGTNVINTPETLYGEVFLQSAVFDPVRGYAYFGTDSNHGQVVKVAIPITTAWLYLPLVRR